MTGTDQTAAHAVALEQAPLKPRIDASARRLLEFLERNKVVRHFDYPHGFSDPHNCCENVSLIFT
ncbi:hypothetical protein [Sphingopyxis sp.]|uniref:hypothetical protein n=1 Tax=Sphingopyxis sp. TaxID=1908224 RepID=UPI003D1195AB